tara:strand:+ start:2152 stop:2385 length:234 start_codon:yes stop_codon:yes gene_type:complete
MGRILVSGLAGSYLDILPIQKLFLACLAQLVERTAFNRMVTGSSPVVGNLYRVSIVEIRPLFMGENPGSTPGHDTLF